MNSRLTTYSPPVVETSAPSIVLVDDSAEVRNLVGLLLRSSGFDVVGEAGDGDEAILLAYRLRPDLMLLDTSMPRCDGVEALPAILALSPSTRVVVFTGFEEPELADHMRQLGAADFIEKSAPLDVLRDRLLAVVRQPGDPEPPRRAPVMAGLRVAAKLPGQDVLNEHVAQFRELFDRAEIGMATLTANGTIVRANRALATLMSCEPTDLVGVEYGRLSAGEGAELDRCLAEISQGADLTAFEHALPTSDGQDARIVRVTVSPIRGSQREVLYVFAQLHDVTAQRTMEIELRRSEETFRRLVNAVREYAIFRLDVDGIVTTWNAGAKRIKGYADHEIIGRHFRVFYPPEEQESGHPEHNLALALRDRGFAEEGWRVRRDGSRFWASVVITPLFDDEGQHVGFAKVTRDETVQREHEEERQRFIDERINLLAVTAHELRNPTAVVDGSAVALQSAWGEIGFEERQEILVGIRTSAERLRQLAADLSAASRADGVQPPMRREVCSLADTLHSAAVRSALAHPDVDIVVDCPKDAVLFADTARLDQALDNLVENAVRHGRMPVTITGRSTDHVRIRVSDAGSGVPAELTPHLFERFASAGSTAGTGLGLYLVREVARRHGGDAVYLPSKNGGSAAFEIVLPARVGA